MASSGIKELDQLLGGGYPVPSAILFEGPIDSTKERILYDFISSATASECCVFVTRSGVAEVIKDAKGVGLDVSKDVVWVAGEGGKARSDLENLAALSHSLKDILSGNKERRLRIAFDIISPMLMTNTSENVYRFVDQFISEIKKYDAVMLATVDDRMHTTQVVASIEHTFDGVITVEPAPGSGAPPSLRIKRMRGASGVVGKQLFAATQSSVKPRGERRPAEEVAILPKERVAVLPLSNFSPDPNDEYFADGMTEELIDRLAQVKGLRIIARTSVMGYKNKERKVSEIGRELGVGTLVEGSVRKAGSRVRITVQLIDVSTEEHIWSDRYDKELDDIFAIQTEIASKITGQIANSISRIASTQMVGPPPPERAAQYTRDMEAYTTYLRGRKLFNDKRSVVTIRQALKLFEEAVQRDPSFSRARVGIAEALLWLATEGETHYTDSVNQARRELMVALNLDSGLAEAHSVLSSLMLGEDDMVGSEREARRAMELNPSLSDPYRWLAQIVAGEGKIDEAVHLLEEAQVVDPLDINVIAFLGRAYAYSGRETDALAHWERTKPLVTYRTNAHLAEYYLGKGDYAQAAEAVTELERLGPERAWTLVYRGILAARTGDKETARRMIGLLQKKAQGGEVTVFHAGFIHFALGDMEAFVECLEKAFELHNLPLLELMYSPLYAPARNDPRIVDLVRRQVALRPAKK
jgi:serine/threonine-protein kinase